MYDGILTKHTGQNIQAVIDKQVVTIIKI